MKHYIIAITLLLLSGCSLTTTVPSSTQYQISMPEVSKLEVDGCHEKTAKIALLQSPSIFKFTQMFYADANLRQFPYTQSSWSESPAERLQTIFVSGLSTSGLFKSVVGYQSIAAYDYLIEIHVYDFMQYFDTNGNAEVRMSFDVIIIENFNHKVLGKFHFNEKAMSESADALGGVKALNTLVSDSVKDVLKWTAKACQ